jgi:hypothetical protein
VADISNMPTGERAIEAAVPALGAVYRPRRCFFLEFKSMLKLVALTGAVVLSCGLAAPASAQTAPDATYGASLGKYANFSSVSYSGVGTFNDGYSTVSVGSQPSPFIHAQAVGTLQNYDPSVSGDITYYVGINGPEDGTFVPIDVAYSMSGQIVSNGAHDIFAQSNLTLLSYYRGNPLSLLFFTQDGNFDVSGHAAWGVASGTTGQVKLNAHSGMVIDISGSGTAEASVDPVFTIDPTFAASHPGYSLVFSQGVGNSPADGVPESAAWALMVAGFGGVGSMLRRRRRSPATAAA